MKAALKAIVLVPLALVVIAFAVANRELATISFDPFNADNPAFALSAPMFLVIILMVMLGVLIGGAAAWLAQGHVRSALRHARAEAEDLRKELQSVRLELDLQRRSENHRGRPALPNRDAA